jgi:hypothetical protein
MTTGNTAVGIIEPTETNTFRFVSLTRRWYSDTSANEDN